MSTELIKLQDLVLKNADCYDKYVCQWLFTVIYLDTLVRFTTLYLCVLNGFCGSRMGL